jgi:hypothetical protein
MAWHAPDAVAGLPAKVSNAVLATVGTTEPLRPLGEGDRGITASHTSNATLMGETELRTEAKIFSSVHYKEMLSRIAVLERLIAEMPEQRPGIGPI